MKLHQAIAYGLCLSATGFFAQQADSAKSSNTPPVAKTKDKTVVPESTSLYRNESLGFQFAYPSELASKSDKDLQGAYQESAGPDSAYKKEDTCNQILLAAHREKSSDKDNAMVTIFESGGKQHTAVSVPVVGTIALTDMDMKCMPAEYQGRDDELMTAFTESAGQESGLDLIDKPIWFDAGKHKIHFAAFQGKPLTKNAAGKQTRSDAMAYEAAVATEIKGHILLWLVDAPDKYSLNRMLQSTLQFDGESAQPLVPLSIGDGKSLKAVP